MMYMRKYITIGWLPNIKHMTIIYHHVYTICCHLSSKCNKNSTISILQ